MLAVMSIEQAEVLKQDLTDKWVVVDKSVPELKRFALLTGKVKTVNMNGQALVEFDSGENIGWFDINPTYLKMVDGPQKKQQAVAQAKPAKATPKAAGGKSPLEMARAQGSGAAKKKPAGGASPLDMIRKQGAKKAGGDSGEKKLSPLEQIRQQGAKKEAAAPAAEPEAASETPTPAEAPKAKVDDGKKLSPLDMIRKQGPAKG